MFVFLVNFTDEERRVPLPSPMDELVAETRVEGELRLAPLGVAVLARER